MQESRGDSTPVVNPILRNAVRLAMTSGAVAGAVAYGNTALAQTASDSGSSEVQEVIVTGSRIPRAVDEATASPITTVDSTAIAQSGAQTIGDLLQQLPSIAGSAQSPAVNNGGGFGESNIELRGLDAKRTLILLDGRRISLAGNASSPPETGDAVDVNIIPVSAIDHVDVLKEGAGAIYGSDAIAGVVNFITRRNVEDLEISGEYGRTTHGDGPHESISALWGGSTDKASFTIDGTYFKQKAVYAAARNFSRSALYLYSGSSGRIVSAAGSSRVPNGRASLPKGYPLRTSLGCSNVTRIDGTDGTTLADYKCLTTRFNYQPFNLIMTPQERGSLFATGNYKITDDLEAYTEVLFNKTHAGFEFAPLPFDAAADNVILSATNEFNPFGLNFGGLTTTNPNYRTRFVTLGDRNSNADSDSKLMTIGLKGKLPVTDWQWDANVGYNRLDQSQTVEGYVYFPGLQNEVGPSFQDGTGAWHCGTDAAHAIAGCTPINFFDLNAPATISQLKALATNYSTNHTSDTKSVNLDVNGTVIPLPAGDLKAAAGFEYRKQETAYNADYIVQGQAPLFISCLISEEACTGNSKGSYNSKEWYLETLVPVLKDLPAVYSLNVDAGVRYSDYSKFGSTTKAQFKIEYKPISDLLLRATFAQVFRVPTLNNLYAAPLNTSATFTDPCYGITAAQAAANPNLAQACNGAALDGSYKNTGVAQITGLIQSNPTLKPEAGHVWTYGFVFQVPGVEALSLELDNWRYDIKNLITALDPNFTSEECIATGAPEFCSLIHRYTVGNNQGQVEVINEPTVNLGELKTDGLDIALKYLLKNTAAGSFRFGLDATYVDKYETIVGGSTKEVAGSYDRQFGNYARWRGTGSIGWAGGNFDGLFQLRYIHHIVVHNPATQAPAVSGQPNPDLAVPRIMYADLTVGYTVPSTKTKVQFGLQNLTNRQPPLLYQNNVINANTDVSTYDLLGRRFFLSINQKL